MNTKQVLQIDYNQQHGLILGWRYTDLNKYLTFFRHVIVVFSDNKENTNHFLKTYLKKIRPGDLYTILYYNHECKLRNKKWREKNHTPDQASDSNDIIQGDITLGDKQRIMFKAEQQFGKFSEPIAVTVYLQNVQLKSWFQDRVLKQRANQKYNFLVGLFGPFTNKTKITFANKVNTIPFPHKEGQTVNFYLKQLYQAAVLWASVSIQCLNAQITSSFQGNWMNTSFNTIQKIYRGPSIQYQKDFLHFYSSKTTGMKHNLMLKLTYVTLQGRKYVSQKQFSVHSFGGFNKLTISISQWSKPHYVSGNIWLQNNPFQTFTIVKFGKQRQEQE